MAYDYTQKVEAVSAFQWTGDGISEGAPDWFNDLNTVSGPIYYPIVGGTLGIDIGLMDNVTGVILPPRIVQLTEWIVKHDDDSFEVLSDTEFNRRYAVTP